MTGSHEQSPGGIRKWFPGTTPLREPPPRLRRSEAVPDPGNQGGTAGNRGGSPVPPPFRAEPGTPTPSCSPGPTRRVIPDRHLHDCDGTDCTGCEPCPASHCQTCKQTHAHVTCPSCLGSARTHLATLRDLTTRLDTEATQGRQAFHPHTEIPGGNALVMLVAAATLRGRSGTPLHLFTRYELPTDPRPPLDVLVFFEELWRRKTNAPTDLPPTMDRVGDYLDRQLHHIAHDPLFTHLHQALRRAVRDTENVLHAGHRPEVSRVPCLECGTRIVKVYASREKHDHWRCPTCGEQYDKGRYERALHDHLASRGAERYVPISDASAASGRPERTVRDWIRREIVDATRDPMSGRLLVWWPDVRQAHVTTHTRRSTG